MPQMAPLSWTLMFLFFITIYLANTAKIYFSAPPSIEKESTALNTSIKNISWKW